MRKYVLVYIILIILILLLSPRLGYTQDSFRFADSDSELDLETNKNNGSSDGRPASPLLYPIHASLFIGENFMNSNDGKINEVNPKGIGLRAWGFSADYFLNEFISLGGSFEWWGEEFKRQGLPIIPGTKNNKIDIGGISFLINGKLNYTSNLFHWYIGTGIGYYDTVLLVTDPKSGLFTTEGAPSNQWIMGYQLLLGVDHDLSHWNNGSLTLGLEVRQRFLEADFGKYTNGKVDLGSTLLLFVLSVH